MKDENELNVPLIIIGEMIILASKNTNRQKKRRKLRISFFLFTALYNNIKIINVLERRCSREGGKTA
jgi:hypothetical protein